MISQAEDRLYDDYNFAGYPSCFFDGGDAVLVGGHPEANFRSVINSIAEREVEEVDIIVGVEYPSYNRAISRIRVTNGPPGSANVAPAAPAAPTGPAQPLPGVLTPFNATTTDGDADALYYQFNWGDREISDWIGPYASGAVAGGEHIYQAEGPYSVTVRSRDIFLAETEWSEPLAIQVGCCVMKGDINYDGSGPMIDDLIYLVMFMFQGGPVLPCMDHADVDYVPTEIPDIADLIYLVQYMFQDGPDFSPCPY
jgi:hypothetical protein